MGVCATGVLLASAGCAVKSTGENTSTGEADLSVDNIEQLRSLQGTPGLKVYVAGFHSLGDGGEGLFSFTAASRPAIVADNVGYLVQASDGSGWWQRQTSSNDVSVKWFGASGDGAHDDTEAVATAAEVVTQLQGRLFLPTGVYKVDGIGTRVAVSNLSMSTDSQAIAKLAEYVPSTGRTISYYPTSVN